MTTTEPSAPTGGASRPDRPSTASTAETLERFWPSRRGHAFDELCR